MQTHQQYIEKDSNHTKTGLATEEGASRSQAERAAPRGRGQRGAGVPRAQYRPKGSQYQGRGGAPVHQAAPMSDKAEDRGETTVDSPSQSNRVRTVIDKSSSHATNHSSATAAAHLHSAPLRGNRGRGRGAHRGSANYHQSQAAREGTTSSHAQQEKHSHSESSQNATSSHSNTHQQSNYQRASKSQYREKRPAEPKPQKHRQDVRAAGPSSGVTSGAAKQERAVRPAPKAPAPVQAPIQARYPKGGVYDMAGFYLYPDNSFVDPDGYFFDSKGYDQYGGFYDDQNRYHPPRPRYHEYEYYEKPKPVRYQKEYTRGEDKYAWQKQEEPKREGVRGRGAVQRGSRGGFRGAERSKGYTREAEIEEAEEAEVEVKTPAQEPMIIERRGTRGGRGGDSGRGGESVRGGERGGRGGAESSRHQSQVTTNAQEFHPTEDHPSEEAAIQEETPVGEQASKDQDLLTARLTMQQANQVQLRYLAEQQRLLTLQQQKLEKQSSSDSKSQSLFLADPIADVSPTQSDEMMKLQMKQYMQYQKQMQLQQQFQQQMALEQAQFQTFKEDMLANQQHSFPGFDAEAPQQQWPEFDMPLNQMQPEYYNETAAADSFQNMNLSAPSFVPPPLVPAPYGEEEEAFDESAIGHVLNE